MKPVIDVPNALKLAIAGALFAAAIHAAAASDIPRTPSGRPDLSGTYDIATLTPLERPEEFGDNLYMTPERAREIEETRRQAVAEADKASAADREAPPAGGDGSPGAAGNVGGYNNFWIDLGDSVIMIDGKFRTSIITDPPNGRQPPMTEAAEARRSIVTDQLTTNEGTAFWLEWDRPGPFDDPERLLASDRCVASFRSQVPSLPSVYNNLQEIVQTDDYVMILNEMIHDARIVRLARDGSRPEHAPPYIKSWSGDSIGWWEGDTLVVDTTNFKGYDGFASTTDTLHVVERFTRIDADTLHYEFTVEDPATWTEPWSGDFSWPATKDPQERVWEYACHEGNYAIGNMLRGARLLEAETAGSTGGE
ncbi:MAG: hypothetical protein R3190_10560 [Thermoanaerobaculia bacterium]|nr:hypothetical protein [Thermoanaerobaculia bacterium]